MASKEGSGINLRDARRAARSEMTDDAFWQIMGPIMRATGNPAGNIVPDASTEAGITGHEELPASFYERAKMLASYFGNALPFRGAMVHTPRPLGGKYPGTSHTFEWAPSEKQLLPPSEPELLMSGTTYNTNPDELQSIILQAAPKPGTAGREMTKIGWDKLNQFYRELYDVFQQRKIKTGTFLPASGKMARGPDVPAAVRLRAFERMAGSKATPILEDVYGVEEPMHMGDYSIKFNPPRR